MDTSLSYSCSPSCLSSSFNAHIGINSFQLSYMARDRHDSVSVHIYAKGENSASVTLDCSDPKSYAQIIASDDKNITSLSVGGGNPFGFATNLNFQLGIGIGGGVLLIILICVAGFFIYKKTSANKLKGAVAKTMSKTNANYSKLFDDTPDVIM